MPFKGLADESFGINTLDDNEAIFMVELHVLLSDEFAREGWVFLHQIL